MVIKIIKLIKFIGFIYINGKNTRRRNTIEDFYFYNN